MANCEGGNSIAAVIDNMDQSKKVVGSGPSDCIPNNGGGKAGGDKSSEEADEPNTRLTSKAWQHYKRQKIGGVWKALCKYCGKKLGGESRNGTTHLWDHQKRCPKQTNHDTKQMLINFEKKKNVENEKAGLSSANPLVVRGKIARMIVLHGFPLYVVEYVGFREVCSELNPTFKHVSRNTIRSDILKMFQNEKTAVMMMLAKSNSRVSITTGMWTSSNQQKGYMAITAHYIDETWTLQSLILRFAYVLSPHTAEALTEVLVECFLDWNVDRKILTVTVDNCSTNDAMISKLLERLDLDSLLLRGMLIHMRCAAHILNLIVKYGLDIIADAIRKVRDSVVFWTASPKRVQMFETATSQLGISYDRHLTLDCKTRWNSTFFMLSSALQYKKVFSRLKQREPLYKSLPSDDDWELAEQVCVKLSYFYDLTKVFSGSRYPTVHLFFNDMCEIRMQLGEWVEDMNSVIGNMARKMLEKFNSYWRVIHGILAVGVFLDPIYKLTSLDHFYNVLMPCVDSSIEYGRIQNNIFDMMCQYKEELDARMPKYENNNTEQRNQSIDNGGIGPSIKKPMLFKASLMKAKASTSQSCSATVDSVRVEFQSYVEAKCLPEQPLDILGWWRTQGSCFPILQAMSRDILVVLVSTVASESSFSTSGNVLNKNRSKLKSEIVEGPMCSQSWPWNQIRDESSPKENEIMELPLGIEDEEDDEEDAVTKN